MRRLHGRALYHCANVPVWGGLLTPATKRRRRDSPSLDGTLRSSTATMTSSAVASTLSSWQRMSTLTSGMPMIALFYLYSRSLFHVHYVSFDTCAFLKAGRSSARLGSATRQQGACTRPPSRTLSVTRPCPRLWTGARKGLCCPRKTRAHAVRVWDLGFS